MAAESRSVVSSLPDDVWHLVLSRLSLRDAGRLAGMSKEFHDLISRLAKNLLQRITRHPYIRESETPWLNRFVDVADRSYKPFGGHPQFLKIIYRIFQAVKNPRIFSFRTDFLVTPEAILVNYQTFLDYLQFYRESSSSAIPLVRSNAVPGNILVHNRVSHPPAIPLVRSNATPCGIFAEQHKRN